MRMSSGHHLVLSPGVASVGIWTVLRLTPKSLVAIWVIHGEDLSCPDESWVAHIRNGLKMQNLTVINLLFMHGFEKLPIQNLIFYENDHIESALFHIHACNTTH